MVRVFIQTLLAYFPEAKLLLNHTEGMLYPGPDFGLLSITRSILVRQLSTIVPLLVDQDACFGRDLSDDLLLARIGRVTPQTSFVTV